MNSCCASIPSETLHDYRRILELIEDASSIAISGHTSPDGDALGSVLGLGLALCARYPEKDIAFLLADRGCVPRIYRFMEGADRLIPAAEYPLDPDLFISVDCPVVERLADSAAVLARARHVVCFDHHPAREEFAEVSVRFVSAAATAVIIDEFLRACEIPISSGIATCLLCGLVTDTGRFQYQNADPAAFACAARLVDAGAEPSVVALEVYQSQRLEYLKLESLVMGRIHTVANGRVAYSYAYASDLTSLHVTPDECDGLVDVVRAVQGVEVCLFVKETERCREVRGNLRSKCDLDVSGVAAHFGGGGHAAAAGFTYEGSIVETLSDALPMLCELVGEDPTGLRVEL
ncbi:DHH family phosphoesterase [Collinsella tanakaei]|uniref:DHH family phosphoesterase n=1 Tax=Collinsella tanakaei TaxID=626935 RepID=UPI0019565CCC|nr:DHH family phosphoesterase [Collinsella tanakaei]MBM6868118.1 DHH family phosphoesterase [Collinsella tanakaei]